MKKKTDLRIMKTKASLYRGFMSLLKTKSFDEISISNICSASLINRSTYYDHFNDKYELLQSMLSDMNDDFLKSFEITDSCKKLSTGLLSVLKSYLRFMEDNMEVFSLITNIPNPSLAKDLIASGIYEASYQNLSHLYSSSKLSFSEFLLFYSNGFSSILFSSLQNHSFDSEKLLQTFQELLSHV